MKLKKSNKAGKKWMVEFVNPKTKKENTIHFGAAGMRDFTLISQKGNKFYIPDATKREDVRSNYRRRHSKDPISNPYTAGALSYHLLWNKPTLGASIKAFEKRFNINIKRG